MIHADRIRQPESNKMVLCDDFSERQLQPMQYMRIDRVAYVSVHHSNRQTHLNMYMHWEERKKPHNNWLIKLIRCAGHFSLPNDQFVCRSHTAVS